MGAAGDRAKITMAVDPLHPHQLDGIAETGVELATAIREQFHKAIVQCGGQRMNGQAPKGQLERLMEARLKRMQKRL